MNRTLRTSVIVAATLAATHAFAGEATYELPQPVTSSVTRAEVLAQLAQARIQGAAQVTEAGWPAEGPFVAAKTRDQVRQEARAAAQNGESRLVGAEPQGFDSPALARKRTAGSVVAALGR